MLRQFITGAAIAGTLSLWLGSAVAHPVTAEPSKSVKASFDIIETQIVTKGDKAIFSTRVRGEAGTDKPAASGKLKAPASMPMSGRPRSTAAISASTRIRASSHLPSPSIRISTMLPTRARTATSGIRIGSCSIRTKPAPAV
jgi:hypothetical protein